MNKSLALIFLVLGFSCNLFADVSSEHQSRSLTEAMEIAKKRAEETKKNSDAPLLVDSGHLNYRIDGFRVYPGVTQPEVIKAPRTGYYGFTRSKFNRSFIVQGEPRPSSNDAIEELLDEAAHPSEIYARKLKQGDEFYYYSGAMKKINWDETLEKALARQEEEIKKVMVDKKLKELLVDSGATSIHIKVVDERGTKKKKGIAFSKKSECGFFYISRNAVLTRESAGRRVGLTACVFVTEDGKIQATSAPELHDMITQSKSQLEKDAGFVRSQRSKETALVPPTVPNEAEDDKPQGRQAPRPAEKFLLSPGGVH